MKTPVEWLEEQININLKDPLSPKFQELFDHAKIIEKEHLAQAYVDGYFVWDYDAQNNHKEAATKYINSKYQSK